MSPTLNEKSAVWCFKCGDAIKIQDDFHTPVVVSELPGYPSRRHVQWSRYEFPRIAMSTIHQNFTQAMPGHAQVWNRLCYTGLSHILLTSHFSSKFSVQTIHTNWHVVEHLTLVFIYQQHGNYRLACLQDTIYMIE